MVFNLEPEKYFYIHPWTSTCLCQMNFNCCDLPRNIIRKLIYNVCSFYILVLSTFFNGFSQRFPNQSKNFLVKRDVLSLVFTCTDCIIYPFHYIRVSVYVTPLSFSFDVHFRCRQKDLIVFCMESYNFTLLLTFFSFGLCQGSQRLRLSCFEISLVVVSNTDLSLFLL